MSDKPFLTATWSDLILLSYAVPDNVLAPYLPPGCAPAHVGGQAFASIVAFNFTQTRIWGLTPPPLKDVRGFPELNLRFYVQEGDRRGVVFVKEFVPSPFIVKAAKTLYNEPYQAAHGIAQIARVEERRSVRYDFMVEGRTQSVGVTAHSEPQAVKPGAKSQFFTEQAWGFGKSRSGKRIEYRVVHPAWRVHEIETFTLKIDFDQIYGPNWHFLQSRNPDSVLLAEGSPVAVYPARKG